MIGRRLNKENELKYGKLQAFAAFEPLGFPDGSDASTASN